jgi:hypothetical protein
VADGCLADHTAQATATHCSLQEERPPITQRVSCKMLAPLAAGSL